MMLIEHFIALWSVRVKKVQKGWALTEVRTFPTIAHIMDMPPAQRSSCGKGRVKTGLFITFSVITRIRCNRKTKGST
jgi:hypothetical protein